MAKKIGIFAEVETLWASGNTYYQLEQLSEISGGNITKMSLDEANKALKNQYVTKQGFIDLYKRTTYASDDENITSFKVYLVQYDEFKTSQGEYYAHEYDEYIAAKGVIKSLPFGMYTQELYAKEDRKYCVGGGDGENYDNPTRLTHRVLPKDGVIKYNKEKETVLLNDLIRRWDNGCGDRGYAKYGTTAKTTLKYDETKFRKIK